MTTIRQFWFPPLQRREASRPTTRSALEALVLKQEIEISELRLRLDDALDGREFAEIRAERAEASLRCAT
jgi:hypothetical protein